MEWYLRVATDRDTCSRMLPGDLDLSGWELRKTLQLFAGCNLPLLEWLGSPVVYLDGKLAENLRSLIPMFFNPRKAMHHCLSMAQRMAKENLGETIKIKRLFYIIRPLCACQWIQDRATMPPTAFNALFSGCDVPSAISAQVERYLEQKKDAVEAEAVQLNPELADWIRARLVHFEETVSETPVPSDMPLGVLDQILYDAVTANVAVMGTEHRHT